MPENICTIDGCGGAVKSRGWCTMHYKRWRRHGDPMWERPQLGCSVPGCTGRHEARGLCRLHYDEHRAAPVTAPAEDGPADMEDWVRRLTAA